MTLPNQNITPHPNFLEALFAYKNQTNRVFNDILGLNGIDHIAISQIDNNHQLLTLSSTPSLEFNLFNSYLWRFDKTYQASWCNLCTTAAWQSLYVKKYYNDLYYQKQIKYGYFMGLSIAIKIQNDLLLYSIASHKNDLATKKQFNNQRDNFYKIGAYCYQTLRHLFHHIKTSGLVKKNKTNIFYNVLSDMLT